MADRLRSPFSMQALPPHDTYEWLSVESEGRLKKIVKKKGDFGFGFTVLEVYTSRKRPARRSCIMITGR